MYDLDQFVNVDSQVRGTRVENYDNGDYDALIAQGLCWQDATMLLEARFANTFAHNGVDNSASPVRVYLKDGVPIAWYDQENCCGYAVYN